MTKTRSLLWTEAGDYDDYEPWDYDEDDEDDGYGDNYSDGDDQLGGDDHSDGGDHSDGDDDSDGDDQLDVSCNYQQAVETLKRNTWTFLWSSPLVQSSGPLMMKMRIMIIAHQQYWSYMSVTTPK